MSEPAWKKAERYAAEKILGGTGRRYWANSGEDVDVENDGIVAQVKNVKKLPFPQLEKLAVEAQRQGDQRNKVGLVLIKRRGGAGYPTPWLVVMTAASYREMSGPLPGERHEPA